MGLLGAYINGNYTVKLFNDGTKIRETNANEFIPQFAENCDVKITDKCDGGCKFCYEGCTISGKHGDILTPKFLDTLKPFTELAINGNDLSHPELQLFLIKLKEKHIVVNMTVNQIHFERHQEFIRELIDNQWIYGLGVSLRNPTKEFIKEIKQYDNAVIHVINGVLSPSDIEILAYNGLKILILGYKQLKRGIEWYQVDHENIIAKQMWLYENLEKVIKQFKVVSFDNLAIEQLHVKRLMTVDDWNEFYMGDDGGFTFYLDLVEQNFGRNSLSTIRYDLLDDVVDMFDVVRKEVI